MEIYGIMLIVSNNEAILALNGYDESQLLNHNGDSWLFMVVNPHENGWDDNPKNCDENCPTWYSSGSAPASS